MTAPRRMQRLRRAGWRMPAGVAYVGRPTRWGNPFRTDETTDHAQAVDKFRVYMAARPALRAAVRLELAGVDLACWCPLTVPCHADVLLAIANTRAVPSLADVEDTVRHLLARADVHPGVLQVARQALHRLTVARVCPACDSADTVPQADASAYRVLDQADADGQVCRACGHTWLVLPRARQVVTS